MRERMRLPKRLLGLATRNQFVPLSPYNTLGLPGEGDSNPFAPASHLSAREAFRVARRQRGSVVFVLTRSDPFSALVARSAIQDPRASLELCEIVRRCTPAYATYSPSGEMLIIGPAGFPPYRGEQVRVFTEDFLFTVSNSRAPYWRERSVDE